MPETRDLKSILAELRREDLDVFHKELLKNWRDESGIEPLMLVAQYQWDIAIEFLPELVSLAKVPPAGYRGFCLAVFGHLLFVDQRNLSTFADEAMLKVERGLRATQDAILALSEEQRGQVNKEVTNTLLTARKPKLAMELHWDRVIPHILVGIAKITGSAPYQPADPSRPGPKNKERINVKLRDFIRDLWSIAQAHGGDFTVTSKPDPVGSGTSAAGTLVDALQLLEPVLPRGFVSRMPSPSTLNRCRPNKK
jgi:hypothetical protein